MVAQLNATLAGYEMIPITPRARERKREAKVYTTARARTHAEDVAEKDDVSMCCKWSQCAPVDICGKRGPAK